MGKNLVQQRRGRGTFTYKAHSHRYKGKVIHRKYDEIEKTSSIKGKIIDIIDCPGHTAPIAQITYENGEKGTIFAFNNLKVNDVTISGLTAPVQNGNTLPLKNIPDGTLIYNIEKSPGNGGTFCRASGTFARVVSHIDNKTVILLPSKKQKTFDSNCRATIGIIAGSGRKEKPFVKAGKKFYAMKARGRLYPITSGVAMNAVDHPFGSGRGRHVGKPKTVSRFAPPGRKVGLIAARRTGRKK